MRFLWFDWDDPRGSAVWSGVITLIGVVLSAPWWVAILGWGIIPLPHFIWNLAALGFPVILIGLLTLGLSAVAWLNNSRRSYK